MYQLLNCWKFQIEESSKCELGEVQSWKLEHFKESVWESSKSRLDDAERIQVLNGKSIQLDSNLECSLFNER